MTRGLTAVAVALLVCLSGAPVQGAAPKPKLAVLTSKAHLDDAFQVPVKVRCKAPEGKTCRGSLKLFLRGQGSAKRAYVVPGGTRRTVRLPVSAEQFELLAAFGSVEGRVRVNEVKPRELDPRREPITVSHDM